MREYGYDEFLVDVKELSAKVREFGADGIVFVARGGATLAHFLAMNIGVRKMYAVNAGSYEGQKKLGAPLIKRLPDLSEVSKIIVADEIVDSGETLKGVTEKLRQRYPDKSFVTASLFQRESALIKADFYVHLTDEWVEFFWERDSVQGSIASVIEETFV